MKYDINYVSPLMENYVDDHKKHFDAWPVDIEIGNRIYDWDEYWHILEKYKASQGIEEK